MKQETIKKANAIMMLIDYAQRAKAIMQGTTRIELVHSNSGKLANLYPLATGQGSIEFRNVKLPDDVAEQIKSELLRFMSRVNRHLDNYEYNLKQELEDLTDSSDVKIKKEKEDSDE